MLRPQSVLFLKKHVLHMLDEDGFPVELTTHQVINDSLRPRGATQYFCTFARF
jgi:hypothetical protein